MLYQPRNRLHNDGRASILNRLRRSILALGPLALAAAALLALGVATALAETSPQSTATSTTTATATASTTATATPTTATTINLKGGSGETGYSVDLYLPDSATVLTGTVVRWTMSWSEPHTVTFGVPPTGQDPTINPNPYPTAPVPYDGTGYLTSGLIGMNWPSGPPGTPQGPTTFAVQFTKPGSYSFFCAIHPNMKGTITVVSSGTVSKQADLDAAGAATYATELAAIKAVHAAQPQTPASAAKAGGGTAYTFIAGGETQNAAVMQYTPASYDIKVGDSITWASNGNIPHTVTFGPPPAGDPFAATPNVPTGGFDGSQPANSAIIGVGYPAGQTFTLTFTKAGSYHYICLLHAAQGMVGVVNVAAAAAPSATPAAPKPPATGSGSAASSDNFWLLAGLAGALFVVTGGASLALRRR